MDSIEGIIPADGKTDRRIVRTRTAIVEAYLRLVLEKRPEEITVSAIAREARVDRKTFYAHFGSIDGLLDAICNEIVCRIADMVEEEFKKRDIEAADRTARASVEHSVHLLLTKTNEAIYSNLALHKRLVEGMSNEEILDRIRVPLEREMIRRNLTALGPGDERMNWAISFFIGGALSMYRTWMTSDGTAPLEDVAEMAEAFMMSGLGAVYGWEDAAEGDGTAQTDGAAPDAAPEGAA